MYASNNALKPRDNDMTDRLLGAIERLILPCEELIDENTLVAHGYKSLIDLLAREIDETVLPRRLALFSGEQAVATLIVSNRRLLQLEIEGKKIKTDTGLDTSPERVANTYAQALQALCARTSPLVLRMVGRASHTSASTACSARHLSEFSEAPCCKNRLKAFLKEIHPLTHGWLFRSDESEAVAHDPDKTVFKKLAALEQKVDSEHEARNRVQHLGRNDANLAAFAISTELQAIVVVDGRDRLIAALPLSEMARAFAHWNTVFGKKRLAI